MVIITITPLVFQAVIYTLSLSLYRGHFSVLGKRANNNREKNEIIGRGTPERQGDGPPFPTSGKVPLELSQNSTKGRVTLGNGGAVLVASPEGTGGGQKKPTDSHRWAL